MEVTLRLDLFDQPYVDEERARAVLADPAHGEVARVAAQRSAVLLRNEGDVLPLDPAGLRSLAVLGPLADYKRDILGPWVFDYDLDESVTVLDGLRDRLGGTAEVRYGAGLRPVQRLFPSIFDRFPGNTPSDGDGFDDEAELTRAVELARECDVAVVVLGSGRTLSASKPRAPRSSCPAVSSSCCRRWSPPAPRSCSWS